MESDAAWVFPATASQAGYTTAVARRGVRSARFGVAPVGGLWRNPFRAARSLAPERNLLGEQAPVVASYSSGYQTISLPADAQTVTLSFWYRPGTQAAAGDFQRALLLDADSYAYIATVMSVLENAATWRERRYDLSAYRGQRLVIYWEVYNDDISAGAQTWLYLDDVSVRACAAASLTVTPTPTGTPTATSSPSVAPTATRTPSATPTATPSPSATPTEALSPSATPTEAPTPSITPTATPSPSATPEKLPFRVFLPMFLWQDVTPM
jgi:hypothetical protein